MDPDSDTKEELIQVSQAARKRLITLMDPVDDPEKPVKRILEYENLCLIFEKTNL